MFRALKLSQTSRLATDMHRRRGRRCIARLARWKSSTPTSLASRRLRPRWRSSSAAGILALVGIDVRLAHSSAEAERAESSARRRAQQHDQGLCMFDAQNRPGCLERALPDDVQHRPAAASGGAAPFAICSKRASRREHSRSTRRAMTPNCARRSSKARPSRSPSN